MNQTVLSSIATKLNNQILLQGEEGQTRSTPADSDLGKKLLFLRNNKNGTYNVDHKILKLILERSEGLTVNVNAIVVTGIMEVIRLSNSTFHINTQLPTLTIDDSTNCELILSHGNDILNVVVANSTNIRLTLNGNTYTIPSLETVLKESEARGGIQQTPSSSAQIRAIEKTQSITRFNATTNSFVTELLIREGNSGFVTESEHKDLALRTERNQQAIEHFWRNNLTVIPKNPALQNNNSNDDKNNKGG